MNAKMHKFILSTYDIQLWLYEDHFISVMVGQTKFHSVLVQLHWKAHKLDEIVNIYAILNINKIMSIIVTKKILLNSRKTQAIINLKLKEKKRNHRLNILG